MDVRHTQTLFGVGARFSNKTGSMHPVWAATHDGYGMATQLLRSEDRAAFVQAVAAKTIVESGFKFIPGMWTWIELPSVAAAMSPRTGSPMGCLPDAALFVRQHYGYDLTYCNAHAFATREDSSRWVWPGAGFAPKEVIARSMKEAVEKVFKFQVSTLGYLRLPEMEGA
jgi:hypothetical protein